MAFTENLVVRRQLSLVWGVEAVQMKKLFDTDESVKRIEDYMRDKRNMQSGERIVLAAGVPVAKRGRTNMIKISTLE
jgi:pyruvate kinase